MRYLLVLLLFVAPSTFAQVNVKSLRPNMNYHYVLLEDSSVNSFYSQSDQWIENIFFNIQIDSVTSPLTQFDKNGRNRRQIVDRLTSLDFLAQYGFSQNLGMAFDFSMNSITISGKDHIALSDPRFQVERRLTQDKNLGFGSSIIGSLYLPLGSKKYFLSNGGLGAGIHGTIEKRLTWVQMVLNLGYIKSDGARYRNIDYSDRTEFGAGLAIRATKRLNINLELQTSFLNNQEFASGPGDAFIGGTYKIDELNSFNAGISAGAIEEDGSSSIRVLAGYKFYPWRERKQPERKQETVNYTRPDTKEKSQKTTLVQEIVKKVETCGVKTRTFSLAARKLTNKEKLTLKKKDSLPYKEFPIKDIGQMDGLSEDIPFVTDSQIVFAIDLEPIGKKTVRKAVQSVNMKIKARKVAEKDEHDSEILCFLDKKICSGELVSKPQFINQAFFEGKETPNDYFSRELISSPKKTSKDKIYYASDLSINLNRVLQNSKITHFDELAFDENSLPQTLYFLVGDDTYVSNDVKLDIVVKKDGCYREK